MDLPPHIGDQAGAEMVGFPRESVLRKIICSVNMEWLTEEPNLLTNVITSYETWVSQFDPKKILLPHCKTPTSLERKKARRNYSKLKIMLIFIIFLIKSVVLIQEILKGQTVNRKYYRE